MCRAFLLILFPAGPGGERGWIKNERNDEQPRGEALMGNRVAYAWKAVPWGSALG